MSFRAIIGAAGTAALTLLALAADGQRNTALADDSGLCYGDSGPLCRTVQVQICQEWQLNSISGSVTGGGLGSTCKYWMTTTYYYYYQSSGGSRTRTGLK